MPSHTRGKESKDNQNWEDLFAKEAEPGKRTKSLTCIRKYQNQNQAKTAAKMSRTIKIILRLFIGKFGLGANNFYFSSHS